MPDGMGCHLPMKLREQNSRSQRKTRIQFSCVPQVAPRHCGNDCQIRWSASVCSLFIITVASVSSSSDSKTLPLLPWLPKILKNICEQTIGTEKHNHSWLHAAACRKSQTENEPHTRRIRCAGVSTGVSTGGSSIPPQDLSCDPARRLLWVPWRRCSRDRPYLALQAREAWRPSLAFPFLVPPEHSRRAAQLHANDVLHRATGPTPHHSFAALESSVALQCVHSCLDESDKIGSQIGNRRGLDNADVIGVVVDGSRVVLAGRPSNRALEWAQQHRIARL